MDTKRIITLAVIVLLVGGGIYYIESMKPRHAASAIPAAQNAVMPNVAATTTDYAAKKSQYPLAQELVHPDGYINTNDKPVTIAQYVGKKVILVDFWTYSCINCQRASPYLTGWYEKYKDAGFVVIGVHTPEFDFEKVKSNVVAATKKFGINYPVVQDNGYQTWDAYKNLYWPHEYLIDINGLVVYDHIGEGNYDKTEKEIQKLLQERKITLHESGAVPSGLVTPGEAIAAGSPETYFGYSRNTLLGNGKASTPGMQTFTQPITALAPNMLYLGGAWDVQGQYAKTTDTSETIRYSYNAKHVYIVASSADASKEVLVKVLRDGVPVAAEKGQDVDANGFVHIQASRLYTLVNETGQGAHTVELQVQGAGLEAFTFTFG
jgi:thiol-disulfide isomerase/thioredoxin